MSWKAKQISSKVIPLIPANEKMSNHELVKKYGTKIEAKFDLDKILEEQNYKGLNIEKINRLIKELDIQEPLEDLLPMI